MIQIGIEVSQPLLNLLAQNEIDIDFVKVAGDDSLERVQQAMTYKPVLIHDISSNFWLNYENPLMKVVMAHARTLLATAKCPCFNRYRRQRKTTETNVSKLAWC